MPSAVLLTGAPLHDLPVFWKNRSGAARMERLTVQMFTFECSSVTIEESMLRGGMNFKESTHSISFFLQIHIRAEWEGKAWFHSSLTSPSGRFIYAQRCLSNVTDAGNSTAHTPLYRWIWIVSRGYVPRLPARSHWSHLSERKSLQVAQQMRRPIGPSDWNISDLSNDFTWTGSVSTGVLASPLFLNSHK